MRIAAPQQELVASASTCDGVRQAGRRQDAAIAICTSP
jgi:hypothetical protein